MMRGKVILSACGALAWLLLLPSCVIVRVPDEIPENTQVRVEVYISGYKSTSGHGNLLEVTTDATASLPLLRSTATSTDE